MTIAASWELAPTEGPRRSESMELAGPADVDRLLGLLSTPPADDAYLDDRRHVDPEASPVVKVAVRADWVYLRWSDDDFDGVPAGDPCSPAAHGGYEPDYPAGTGLSMKLAASALKEFLVTGVRPTVVAWVDLDDVQTT